MSFPGQKCTHEHIQLLYVTAVNQNTFHTASATMDCSCITHIPEFNGVHTNLQFYTFCLDFNKLHDILWIMFAGNNIFVVKFYKLIECKFCLTNMNTDWFAVHSYCKPNILSPSSRLIEKTLLPVAKCIHQIFKGRPTSS